MKKFLDILQHSIMCLFLTGDLVIFALFVSSIFGFFCENLIFRVTVFTIIPALFLSLLFIAIVLVLIVRD